MTGHESDNYKKGKGWWLGMSKISCDVTRDLLASYLDEICSDESRGLVEEHLRECPSCKQFVEQIREQDLGRDAGKVDFFKRVRWSMSIRSWLAVTLAVALMFMGHPHINQPRVFYYIVMPILMLIGVLMPVDEDEKSLPARKEWIVPALGFVVVCAALSLQIMACCWFGGIVLAPRPDVEMGPWIEQQNIFFAVMSAVLLFISCARLKGRKNAFIISQNLAWLGMNLVLSCDSMLYHLEERAEVLKFLGSNIIIIVLEFVVMTVLMLGGVRFNAQRSGANGIGK